MYKCEIIADSLSPQGNRLTTFLVTYPRIVHAEMLRHRMFSRNVASSRAIPFEKMVKDVEENPFIPIAWQKSHKGMQGSEYFTSGVDIKACRKQWLDARDSAVLHSSFMYHDGTTKQLCNRVLEPFVWTTELITTGEEGLRNFFELRCPKYDLGEYGKFKSKKDAVNYVDGFAEKHLVQLSETDWLKINKSQAEIHIQKIAEMMWDTYNESKPKELEAGEWHIPFNKDLDGSLLYSLDKANINTVNALLKIATARCARLSYTTLGDSPKVDYKADIKLHDRLLESHHMSPFEHCAKAMSDVEYYSFIKGRVPTQRDEYGILNYEYYPYSDGREGEFWMGFNNGVNPNNGDRFGLCNNFKGFIQYRYLVEND